MNYAGEQADFGNGVDRMEEMEEINYNNRVLFCDEMIKISFVTK